MGGVGGWLTRSLRMSTTLVSSAVGMAAGLVQVGVVTELGLEGSVYKGEKKLCKLPESQEYAVLLETGNSKNATY